MKTKLFDDIKFVQTLEVKPVERWGRVRANFTVDDKELILTFYVKSKKNNTDLTQVQVSLETRNLTKWELFKLLFK